MNTKQGQSGLAKQKNKSETLFSRLMPWRLKRLLMLIRLNNVRPLIAKILFIFKPPKHRVLISAGLFGGVGGTEKHLMALVESMPDFEFYIFARELRIGGFLPKTSNYYLNIPPLITKKFSLYFYFCGGGKPDYIGDKYTFQMKMIVTNAANIRDIESKFDYIAIQSENFDKFCDQHEKCIRAFPNVPITLPSELDKVSLPEKYLVTVFNPFSAKQKGNDLLYKAADNSALPIVWCFSDFTGWNFDSLPEHPNIIKKKNLTQSELYYVYANASAYVSFALYESWGWSLAESYYLKIPIISRNTGMLSYVSDEKGIYIYESEDELDSFLTLMEFEKPQYNIKFLEEDSYRNVFIKLLD